MIGSCLFVCLFFWRGGGGRGGGMLGLVCLLSGITEVHVIDIFVGIDFEDLFNTFCDYGRFLKE